MINLCCFYCQVNNRPHSTVFKLNTLKIGSYIMLVMACRPFFKCQSDYKASVAFPPMLNSSLTTRKLCGFFYSITSLIVSDLISSK